MTRCQENLWQVCLGDPTHVSVPGLAKPINCYGKERAQFVADAVNATPHKVKNRPDVLDALLDLRGRLLTPASKWNAQARAEALTVVDRALEAM